MQLGPDISVSLAGIRIPGSSGQPRDMLDWAHTLGVRAVVLDGAAPGFRARELGRSARRDLAASMRRRGLELAGIDLWIPAEHFSDPEHCERAAETVIQCAMMAHELAELVGDRSRGSVSILTAASIAPELYARMSEGSLSSGAVVVDHRTERDDDCPAGIAYGVDPAAVLISGGDPASAVHGAGDRLGAARLDDVNAMGRCPVGGEGSRLDLDQYKSALLVSRGDWLTVDLRQLPDSVRSFQLAREAWESGLGLPAIS